MCIERQINVLSIYLSKATRSKIEIGRLSLAFIDRGFTTPKPVIRRSERLGQPSRWRIVPASLSPPHPPRSAAHLSIRPRSEIDDKWPDGERKDGSASVFFLSPRLFLSSRRLNRNGGKKIEISKSFWARSSVAPDRLSLSLSSPLSLSKLVSDSCRICCGYELYKTLTPTTCMTCPNTSAMNLQHSSIVNSDISEFSFKVYSFLSLESIYQLSKVFNLKKLYIYYN